MKPVHQKVICGKHGDCVPACLASILEIPLEEVAPFNLAEDNLEFFDQMLEWLRGRGYNLVYPKMVDGMPQIDYLHMLEGTHCILSVHSQLFDATHAVVGQFQKDERGIVKMKIVHDPNLKNESYPDDVEILGVEFLVKM